MIDTFVVREHQHGACTTRNQRRLTSKIHAVVDSNGLPVRLTLSPGEAHHVRLVGKLLSRLKSGSMLLADPGYEADWIRELFMKKAHRPIFRRKAIAAIRSTSVRIYRAQNQAGRFFNRIKQCLGGDVLRQIRRQLPRLRPTRIYPAMAGGPRPRP
ncbi:transposase [Bradyrhizobium sp. USDA 4516]